MDHIKGDERFSHISKDPRFRKLHRKERKVHIDKRFKSMFNDKRFKLKYMVDKRGRPLQTTTNENLRKYYDLSDSGQSEDDAKDEEEDEEETAFTNMPIKDGKEGKQAAKDIADKNDDDSENSDDDEDANDDKDAADDEEGESGSESSDSASQSGHVMDGPDLARGEGDIFSSDEDEDYEIEDSVTEELPWGEIDHDAPEAEDVSRRLAVCNMDWDRIKARDLMVLFNSFKPVGGVVRSVSIYPSEFGLQRMKEENIKGPSELVNPDDGTHDEEDEEYHIEKLRKYQLNRLKYYYAVVECDSSHTASKIYDECDGMEYEGSSSKLDLRYIPDDMSFADQEPKSQITDAPDASTYKPSMFLTSALQQSKVRLTWDETDRDRMAVTMKKFTKDEIDNLDVRDYLASDSDEAANPYGDLIQTPDCGNVSSGEDEEAQIQKYRQLLQGIQDTDSKHKDKDMEMEISWEPGLKDTTSDLVKKNQKKVSITPWEEYLEKRKEKKKKKRKERKLKQSKDSDKSGDEEGLSDDDLPAGVDLDDPYFKEELQKMSGKSNTADKSKKKKKKKKQKGESQLELEDDEDKRRKAELELLLLDEGGKKHFNLKNILEDEKPLKGKKKRRMRKLKEILAEKKKLVQDDFEIDVDDSRFKELYNNPLFNLDPTAPEFKKTKAMDTVITEKIRRRIEKKSKRASALDSQESSSNKKFKTDTVGSDGTETHAKDHSLASLVKSVKAKTKSAQQKKKQPQKGPS